MCGVAAGVAAGDPEVAIRNLRHRGPDAHGVVFVGSTWLAHTRLSILDLDARSNQPFIRGDLTLSYNGELWNHDALRRELAAAGHAFHTSGDTEVVAAALQQWGSSALARMQGMFAIAWVGGDGVLNLARDRFGEVPLHVAETARGGFLAASEMRALVAQGADARAISDVGPGEHWQVARDSHVRVSIKVVRWYDPGINPGPVGFDRAVNQVRQLVKDGVQERAISDVPVCTLLSGGIDSAAALAFLKEPIPDITAYIAVMDEGARDLRCARATAEMHGVELREVRVPAPTADDLASVVRIIEQSSKAQVEIGWACIHLARRMQQDGFKVTFSGEGSDELWASYGFAQRALALGEDWFAYRKKLFLTQARKNFPRANKAFMAHGVECRLPFLNTGLVERALTLPREDVGTKARPKMVLQEALRGMVPDEVVRRPKVAFQDGMGLKEVAEAAVSDPQRYYKNEFSKHLRGS